MSAHSVTNRQPSTLIELLRHRALCQAQQEAYTFLLDDESEEARLTYEELDARARAIAAWLQSIVANGDRVLLLYPPGLDYIAAFFGCLYAGAIAVPAYPPKRNRSLLRLQAIVSDAKAGVALTTGALLSRIVPLFSQNPYLEPLRWLATDKLEAGSEKDWQEPAISGEDLAFFQYTSGSTGAPKGVMLTHANLLHNAALIYKACGHTPADRYVSWLPTFHDMGFMAGILQPLYGGFPVTGMSPASFLQRPLRWLKAISKYRATTSGGPNFAYDLCTRKITPEQRATLDLSSWKVAFNGAEPIRRDTLERFTESFAPCGFRPSTFYPCYGLAEATLMVTGSRPASAPLVKVIEAGALEKNLVVEAGAGSVDVRAMIGCGRTLEGQQVIIVNTESLTECPPGEVGEIWVSGPSVAQGYWNRPEETEATFRARLAGQKEGFYLRTGDLGFLDDGELFVTGRFKDLIIIRGLNHYPQDIELSVEQCHPALRRGCGAAFSIEVAGEEQLVIVQEVEVRQKPDFDALIGAIQHALALEHELQAFAVVLVRPGTIPKTSSGKIQRHACRAGFIQTTLDVVAEWRRPFIAEPETTDSAAPPAPALESTGEVEEWLRSELAARLKLAPSHIESDEPITHYGLDSLTAVELTQSIEAAFGVNLPVAAILQSWSIESLAAYLFSQAVSAGNAPRRALIAAQEREAEHPLSYGQQALWFLHQLEPQSSAYNIARAVRIEAELDSEALRRSFQTLVDRHASLRTTFHAPRGEPFQRIHEYMEVCFQEEDGASWDASFLDERLVWEAHRPFDLEHGPLLRVHIFTRGPSDHFLLLVVHHIVADFWSLTLLAHELGILYRAEKERRPASLPPLSLQYTDYVRWQKEMLNGAAGEKDWSYWQEQLKDVSWLNLPVDRPRPRAQSYEGASLSFRLSEALTAELKMIGRAQGATLYMLLLAAFKLLLHRYSGQEDIVVGTPTAGRGWAALSALVGYFVNPVVMRARLSGNPTFKELLGHVRQVVLEAFEHIDYPFALLVQRLQVERDPSRNTLFQVMFVLQKAHLPGDDGLASFALGEAGARHSLGGLPLESVALQGRAAQFDLTLMMAEVEGGLAASLEYSTELYEAATVERMARHFTLLLEQIARDPGLPVSRLQFLSAEEQRQLLFDWNQTLRLYPAIECLHHTFEAQARLTPSRVAVRDGEQSLSYGELNRRSNQLAQHLRALGLGAESPVAVIWKRTVEMVVCLLAVLKAGAAYVPLDPSYPRDRLRLMIEDSGAELVLAEAEFARVLDEVAVPLISPDRMWNELAGLDDENPQSRAGRENLAYVIYTSGSTGRPKGVAIEHKSSVNFVQWAIEEFTAETLSAVLASTSICFDLSVFEIFAPLACGGQVLMAENALDLGRLAGGESVRLINTVPSAASALLRLKAVPQSVRVMNLAGEPLRRSLVDEIYSSTQVEEVNNLYGPTEYTTYTTRARVERGSQREPAIGRAIANTELYILDEEQQVVAVGVCGEIYVGGAGLARCYVGRPEQTAASFVPHPFGSRGGERLYRTGDVARYRADGEIEYVGRKDEQVKVRGYRIEPGEVESILLEEEGVKECVVALREDAGGDKRLVAYVVGADGRGPSAAELRLSLKERVPDYMLPSAFVQLEALPLTPNGKLDRRALPAPEESGFEQETAVAARTPIEEIVAGIWSELLGLSRVGSDANFFELGGHSLLAVQVISRLRHLFHLELPLRALFEEPTVSGLSRKIAMAEHLTPVADFLPISRAEREKPLPLSFAQQRLWFLNQLERDSAFYNMPAVLRLKGYLQGDVLARSLREIVRRHEVLRTTFRFVDEEPRQVIAPEPDIPLVKMSLCDIEEPEARELRARALSIREAREPFDLAHGPLVRLTLLQLGEQEHWLLLTMHHIVCDEWSIRILMRELATLYTAYAAGRESPLEELPVQYADYAVWQREWLQGETLERQLSYWKQQLAGAPLVLELPTDRPRPPIQTHRGRSASFELAADLSLKLRGLGHREGVTPFMLLLSAFAALLYRYTGQAEIVVGTPYANRNRREVESLIGCFVNTLALPLKMSGAQGFAELLDEVRELALDAHAHQDVAFEKLVEELQPTRDLSRQPLFQVMFALQSAPDPRVELPGLNVNLLETDTETAKFDLTFALALRAEGIGGAVEYSTDLYDAATVERMIGHFRSLLEAIAADPKQPLSTLALLTKAEREQLLVEWNETAADYRACALHELFERQAKATPRAAALIYGDEQLSYGELNERAGRLSHYLSSLGVRAGARVGICVSRSMEMIVGLLGILKTGCTYLPLDPDNPRERLSFIIEDAQAHLILTETGLREKLPGLSPRIVNLEEIALDCPAAWDENRPALPAESPAYLIYTSGSTGRPKGVLVSHAAISNHLQWMAEEFPLSTGDRVLQKYSISFDASVVEIFHPLMSGACLVIVEPGRQHDIAHLVELMIKQRVTAIDVVPTMLKFLLEEERLAECQSLRRVACGGESLEAQLVARFYQRLEGVELSNLYGPTEATVGATFYKLSRPAAVPGVAIGRPIANSQLYILDRYQEPVPVGVAGEIYIGGKGLALGYWNQPRSTAEKFIPDPFGKEDGARLYRTGDRGRYWPDGNVEFLGRSDYQVKIRGYRIEVEEIEAALRRHPAIREAVVMATRNERGDQQLTGYLVPDGPGPTGGELRQWLENSLPGFMIPASFTVTDELPLTPNGKVDRQALRDIAPRRAEALESALGPRSTEEELLITICSELLGVRNVSPSDNFFGLGGHSLLATQLLARIRQVFGVELPLRALFESSSLADLARRIKHSMMEERGLRIPPLGPRSRRASRQSQGEQLLPLSFAQQRLWFLEQLTPGTSAYNIATVIRLAGRLDQSALLRGLNEIVSRHESLRTSFHLKAGEPVQAITEGLKIEMGFVSLAALPREERERAWRRMAAEEARKPFDLQRAPLLRASLLEIERDEHLLFVTMHHIVSDGWSLTIFARELASTYEAYRRGAQSPLSPLKLQYPDYAEWQRQWLTAELLDEQLRYWRSQLSDLQPMHLPTDHPRSAVLSYEGASYEVELSRELTDALREQSLREGATLYMTLLSAFSVLLRRMSGGSEAVIGTVVAGRQEVGLEELIGFFVNTLVMRVKVEGGERFGELVRGVREVAIGGYMHQEVPFERVVEEVGAERDISRNPLFQVLFNMINIAETRINLPGLTVEVLTPAEPDSKFDLTLYAQERAEGLALKAVYDVHLFEKSRIVEMVGQLKHLIAQIVENPDDNISRYSLVTPRAQAILPNPTEPLPARWEGSVTSRLSRQAQLAGERLAVVDRERGLSYRELDARSNQVANYLRDKGVKRQEVVAVYCQRAIPLVLALLGTLKAGAAFLILDPDTPPSRLSDYVGAARPRACLRDRSAGALPEALSDAFAALSSCSHLDLSPDSADETGRSLASYSTDDPGVVINPDDIAYITFTSGSTGQPKGIVGTHRPLAHFLDWHSRRFELDEADRFSMLSGLTHDPLLRDIFTPLWIGATLCIPDTQTILGGSLAQWMKREEISVAHLTPAMLQLLVQPALAGARQAALPSLRYAFFGGDVLTRRHLAQLGQLAPSATGVNFYGATETPQAMAYFVACAAADSSAAQTATLTKEMIPLGQGIEGAQLLILNEARQQAGVGELGEIYVRSPYLAKGYLDDEALTGEHFMTNPFTQSAGDRLYRTGDLGRYAPDGAVEFFGRADEQVKIRGYRIEPAEVERALREHPSVRDCAVAVREDEAEDKRLVAYVVAHDDTALSLTHLRRHLRARLPQYMLPAAFVQIERVPLTPNGKVDWRALPAPESDHSRLAEEPTAAVNLMEEMVASIWAAVLKVERVGTRDNFFDLGGHSLLAIQLVSRLNREFKIEIPLSLVFEFPTVADQAGVIETMLRAERDLEELPLSPISAAADIPLSFAQQRLWLLSQLEPESLAYNIFKAIRLRGPLNVTALARSLEEVLRRHEALRTTVAMKDRKLIQVIAPPVSFDLPLVDLSRLAAPEREAETRRLIAAEAERRFELSRGPLWAARLLRLQEDEHVFLLTLHHIISDGWSLGLFVNEMAVLYESFSQGKRSPLAELPIQYKDFAVWQREWLQGETLERQLSYWKRQLAGAPPELALPTDKPRHSAARSSRGATRTLLLEERLARDLKALSREQGATVFMVMLAMMKALLFKWTGQSDLVVGTVVANRNRFEAEQLIGCFINFLPVRSLLSADQTGSELLQQVKAVTLEACSFQDCPFDKIVEAVNPAKRLGRSPIYNVAFFMQNTPFLQNPSLGEELELIVESEETDSAPLDLRFIAYESSDRIVLKCEYSTDLFEAETIEHLVASYVSLLAEFIARPAIKLSDLKISDELAAQAERARSRDAEQTIAVAATFTAEPVEASIAFWMEKLGLASHILFAPYNQVFQQLLDQSSLLMLNRNGVNVILLRFEDWHRFLAHTRPAQANEEASAGANLRETVEQLLRALKSAVGRSAVPFIVCLCPASPQVAADPHGAAFNRQMEELVVSGLKSVSDVYVMTSEELLTAYPVASYHNAHGDQLGHVPYTQAFFTALGSSIARKINAIRSVPYKVIVLDCDQTLWKGVCGEDGAHGIEIDEAHRFLQEFIVSQHDAGRLICLCSKNNEEDVFAVMDHHLDMPLKREHLLSWRINWNRKSENLRSLAEELKLGLDSFILLDDDPVECAEVQANCPEVLTLQLPREPHKIAKFLSHVWAFDHLKVTEEDSRRTALYRQSIQSARLQQESLTFADFLASLNLEVHTSLVAPDELARVAQLLERTNQFNFTGIRRSEAEVRRLCESGQYRCLVTRVSDRFGDYGLVGAMIFSLEGDALKVDSYVLSCRALGRGVEHQMLARLGAIALEHGRGQVAIRFVRTKKNQPALDFLNSIGALYGEPGEDGFLFRLPAREAAALTLQTVVKETEGRAEVA